jgi:thymidylate synthase (FAD)
MNKLHEEELSVSLISYTPDPEKVIANACLVCYSSKELGFQNKELTDDKISKIINNVIKRGHTSVLEHANFTFAIEGISRACSHQLVRHRIASYSQQSQRFVDFEGFSYVIPPEIKNKPEMKKVFKDEIENLHKIYITLRKSGISKEDARFILPNASTTKLILTMNARSLLNFFKLRTCNRAQWEIRILAREMLGRIIKIAPALFKDAGPPCRIHKCLEGELSCGNPPIFPWEITND